jgi:hypothetical protein
MPRLASPLGLPTQPPPDVDLILEAPEFDAATHLALEWPDTVYTLKDLGYSDEDRALTPSDLAITSPFRIMSPEGVAVMRDLALDLHSAGYIRPKGPGRSGTLHHGVYRARYLQQFMNCPELLDFMSELSGTRLVAHPFPPFQAYFNYWAEDPSKHIDDWHLDSLGYGAVMMVSDPEEIVGGAFEYFHGSRTELMERFGLTHWEELRRRTFVDVDPERIVEVRFPAAGYGMFMQGDHVFHRAAKADAGRRITMVPGFASLDLAYPDRTNRRMLGGWLADSVSIVERVRVDAWLGREKLATLLDDMLWADGDDVAALADALEHSITDVQLAIAGLRAVATAREQAAPASGLQL